MLIKGRISKKLTGVISLPTVSIHALKANTEFEIDEKQFWASDIQRAWQMKKIVFTSKIPEQSAMVIITNVSPGIVTIPGRGILTSAVSMRITKEESEKAAIRNLFENGLISIGNKRKPAKKQKSRSGIIVIDRKKAKKKSKDFNPITWTPKEQSSTLIDTEAPEKNDEIDWVDVDDVERIKNHPILGKKYAKNNNSKSKEK